ncbi:Fur family transcriptional regulator [Echinicola sp. 20G]|uniref:Fur family transcriptional regulator n=1 Tax=Echinicola sp. 20G TaxID=2781961 RepID=UPI00190FE66B|nr:transcriptional repressor [Echinicola sp. 20G]
MKIKSLEKHLSSHSIRPTAMRLLVLETLLAQKVAISLTDLENSFEHSDRVTLYRTLKTFQEKKIIHSIDDGTGVTKYALCEESCNCAIEKDLHVYFYCRICNGTFCLPHFKIPSIGLPKKFVQEKANLVVKGICDQCS